MSPVRRKVLNLDVGLDFVTFQHDAMKITIAGLVLANEVRRGMIPHQLRATILDAFGSYKGATVTARTGDENTILGIL